MTRHEQTRDELISSTADLAQRHTSDITTVAQQIEALTLIVEELTHVMARVEARVQSLEQRSLKPE